MARIVANQNVRNKALVEVSGLRRRSWSQLPTANFQESRVEPFENIVVHARRAKSVSDWVLICTREHWSRLCQCVVLMRLLAGSDSAWGGLGQSICSTRHLHRASTFPRTCLVATLDSSQNYGKHTPSAWLQSQCHRVTRLVFLPPFHAAVRSQLQYSLALSVVATLLSQH